MKRRTDKEERQRREERKRQESPARYSIIGHASSDPIPSKVHNIVSNIFLRTHTMMNELVYKITALRTSLL